jgi:hypothetical protein
LSRRDQTGEIKRVGARVLRKRQRRVRTSYFEAASNWTFVACIAVPSSW